MRQLCLEPEGWPCTLSECPPGLFVFNDIVGFKSEYGARDESGRIYSEVFCADTGEYFWGGTSDKYKRELLVVQPVVVRWAEKEV